jgi:hypothetical protein
MPPLLPTRYISPFWTRKSIPMAAVSPTSPLMRLNQLSVPGSSVLNAAIRVPSSVMPNAGRLGVAAAWPALGVATTSAARADVAAAAAASFFLSPAFIACSLSWG